jgi:hypothetical protein
VKGEAAQGIFLQPSTFNLHTFTLERAWSIDVAEMTGEEVNAFLDSRPGWVALTTIGTDGYPHTVPIGYFRMDDDVYMGCRAGTQWSLL